MAQLYSFEFTRIIASVVLVASKTRLSKQDAILCRVFHPDERNSLINIPVSPKVTVSQFFQAIEGRPGDPIELQHHLTIILAPTGTAQELIVSRDLPPASTVHIPLEGASTQDPYYFDQVNDVWAAGRFRAALDALRNASSATLLGDLSIIPASERDALLQWAVAPPSIHCGDYTLIHSYFERVAEENPNFVAVHCTEGVRMTVTYQELNNWANALATHLVEQLGVCPGDLVLEYFDKGVEMLVGILAVCKAGAAYVNIDIEHPATRIQSIHRTTEAKLCLTTASLRAEISSHIDITLVSVDEFTCRPVSSVPPPALSRSLGGEDLCYVMFTSGSTGAPKGVMVTHSCVVSSVINGPDSNQRLRAKGQHLRTLMFSNYAFDYSVWDIFLTLTGGGTLCISPKSQMLNDLTGTLRSLSITFLETTPTVLSLVDPAQVPSLDTVYSSGEPLTPAVREKFQPHLPKIRLFNGGAPTECTVMSVFTPIKLRSLPGIFGRPFGGNRTYVLDDDKQLCPVGVPGRLWIGGPQVSKGYLGRDDLTAVAYAPDPYSQGGRMYNTGDVCLWAPDELGSEEYVLFYMGRADTQVKIRGQRIETAEIEAILVALDGVTASGVVKRERSGTEELVAFIEIAKGATQETVLQHVHSMIRKTLPQYMIPSAIIPLLTLPVTLNGKLDRNRLEKLSLEATEGPPLYVKNGVLPHQVISASEKIIRDAWATVLNRPAANISLDADFYGSGGDSISCIRVAAACRSTGYSLSIMDFVDSPTISSQARLVDLRSGIRVTEAVYRPFDLLVGPDYRRALEKEVVSYGYRFNDVEDAYPSPPPVSGLISLAAGNPLSYFAQYVYRARTRFIPECMEAAWHLLLQRHEILRSMFIVAPPPHRDIVQVVLNNQASPLSWESHTFSDDIQRDAAVEEYLKRAPGFALGKCPTRVGLFNGPDTSAIVFQLHHSQYDGWAFPHLLRDLQNAYNISSGSNVSGWLDSNPTPYSHFARWSLDQDTGKASTYWRSQLADLSLPSWPKVPVFNVRTRAVTDQSSVAVFRMGRQLADFCVVQRVSLSSAVRTALAITLGLHETSSDVLFGVVTSGRTGEFPGVEKIFGSCISTIPCRVRLPSDLSLQSILHTVHAHSVESVPFQFAGLHQILKAANFDSDIFRVLLTIENIDGLYETEHEFLGENVRGHLLEMNYPLAISVFPSPDGSEIRFQFQSDSEYLSAADIEWVQEHLFTAISALIQHPELSVADSNLLSPKEDKFVREIGIGSTPDAALLSKFFHCMVDETAARVPSNTALEYTSGETMTYESLVNLANQVAHGLQTKGVRPEICVPVLFDKNTNQIHVVVAFLAVLKAGGALVPLDSSWPIDRLASCIQQTNANFFICDSSTPAIAHSLPVSFLHIEALALGQPKTPPVTPDLTLDSLCYVMFTSGSSTGKPKGVLVEHSNAAAFVANAWTAFPLTNARRFLHFSPWTFDQGLADLLLAFPIGGTVILASMNEMLMDLTATLNSRKADYTVLTPAVAQLIHAGTNLPHLRTLVCGGEKLPGQLVHRWAGKLELIDAYGPTECTVHGTSASFKHSSYVPGVIGMPLGSTRAYIVDQCMRPVPVGATGELMLAGNQVARGYLNLPEETAVAFIADPFHPGQRMYRSGDLARFKSDGRIEYLGRKEGGYIKLRGLRIDVAEIEATLNSVAQTIAVVELLTVEQQPHLVAFLAHSLSPAGDTQLALPADLPALQPWIKVLSKTCKRILPAYSVPTLWIALDAIPQVPSNKYNRKLLRSFFESLAGQPGKVEEITRILLCAKPFQYPETALEKKLHAIWCELLGKEEMSVHDDFFNAGGDSLRAIRVLARLRNKGCHLTIQDFYGASTIASLAHFIGSSGNDIADDLVEEPVLGLVFPVQKYTGGGRKTPLWFLHCAEGVGHEYMNLPALERDVYAISNPSKNRMGLEANFPTLESFTDKYLPLMPPDEPIFLGGYSSGGLLAILIAARRCSLGQPVKGLVLFDTFMTQGWTFRGFAPDTDYGSNHISNALNPSAKELQRLSERHTYHLIQHFIEPKIEVPVLLLRAGVRDTSATEFYVSDGGDDELNFFTRENMPLLEVHTVAGAEHADMVGYVHPYMPS
ncbi:acetyl-CoA synthetase-like protein [Mycena galericulata]|nr:acetyl-CoA synthetase-like protein [Mycena galericulata]